MPLGNVPMLTGWLDQAMPGIESTMNGLHQFFNPNAQYADEIRRQIAQDPAKLAQLALMEQQSPGSTQALFGKYMGRVAQHAGLDSSGLRERNASSLLNSGMTTDQAAGQPGIAQQVAYKDIYGETSDTTKGKKLSNQSSQYTVDAQAAQAPYVAQNAKLTNDKLAQDVEVGKNQVAEAQADMAKRQLASKVKANYNGDLNALYNDWAGGKFDVPTASALMSDKGLESYFTTRSSRDMQQKQLDQMTRDRQLNREQAQEMRRLTFAQASYNASGMAGSLQAHLALQDPQTRIKANQLADMVTKNPQQFAQIIAQDPQAKDLADAALGIRQAGAAKTSKMMQAINENLQQAVQSWPKMLVEKKADAAGLAAETQALQANVTDNLQQLAAINGVPVDIKVIADDGKSDWSGRMHPNRSGGQFLSRAPTLQVQLTSPGVYSSQPMSLDEARNLIVSKKFTQLANGSASPNSNDPVEQAAQDVVAGKAQLTDLVKSTDPQTAVRLSKRVAELRQQGKK